MSEDPDAALVVDGSADEIIAKLISEGWTLTEREDHIGGKRIRYVQPPVKELEGSYKKRTQEGNALCSFPRISAS